jgi:hypothetical protein
MANEAETCSIIYNKEQKKGKHQLKWHTEGKSEIKEQTLRLQLATRQEMAEKLKKSNGNSFHNNQSIPSTYFRCERNSTVFIQITDK